MNTDVIICVIAESEAETAINNLIEFGIQENKISLVMKNTQIARKIQADTGPLAGTTMTNLYDRLIKLEATEAEIRTIMDEMNDHNCLLGVETGISDTELTKQTLQDYKPMVCNVYPNR